MKGACYIKMHIEQVKNIKGVTLVALVIYIFIFTIILGVMTTISTSFFNNIGGVVDTPKYLLEFNKFSMFFVTDAKNYSRANVTDTTIQFENGPMYKFQNNNIYRNDTIIAKNVLDCTFSTNNFNVNNITKQIVNVNMKMGKNDEKYVVKNVDFTLKYW